MFFRKLSAETLWVFVAFAAVGCSVLEDRLLCPCALTLCFGEVVVDDFEAVDVKLVSADDFLFNTRLANSDYAAGLVLDVPKGDLNLNVLSCRDSCMRGEVSSAFKIPYGSQCPQVYMYSVLLDTRCETLSDTVRLHKNYCKVTIEISSQVLSDGTSEIELDGNVDGYDIDGSISEGPFLATAAAYDQCVFQIPRQKDNSLMMKIRQGDSVLRIFPIGEYIVQSGYDWKQADLEDIRVTLDYANMNLTVKVAGSSGSYYFELEV